MRQREQRPWSRIYRAKESQHIGIATEMRDHHTLLLKLDPLRRTVI